MDAASLYRRMALVRCFEDAVAQRFFAGELPGIAHLGQGQEAVAVGVCAALRPDDVVAATYRGHAACLAKGVEPVALARELLGRAAGPSGGRAGSMNVVDLRHGLLGCFAIIGHSLGAATGAALHARVARTGGVAVAFFGEGAANQAYFHECLNLAAVRSLPVVYACENNLYGEWTPMADVTGGGSVAARAAAYGMPGEEVDGNDVLAVADAAAAAVERARRGDGPTLLECLTYRHGGHSLLDAGRYRPPDEVERWRARDPLVRLAATLGEEAAGALRAEVEQEVERAFAAAVADPLPNPAELGGATRTAA